MGSGEWGVGNPGGWECGVGGRTLRSTDRTYERRRSCLFCLDSVLGCCTCTRLVEQGAMEQGRGDGTGWDGIGGRMGWDRIRGYMCTIRSMRRDEMG